MITIYDLLEVKENASKQDIENSYLKLIEEYKISSINSIEKNNDNEIILRKLKLAYDILMNDEKRKRYDNDLSKMRTEELIANVAVETPSNENNENNENNNTNNKNEKKSENNTKNDINIEKKEEKVIKYEEKDVAEIELTKAEKDNIKKAAEKEFKQNLKRAQKAEEEYNKAYNEAYNDYLRKMGFTVKEPWTFSRIKNLIVGLFIIAFICIIIWKLPLTRELLIQLYEENFIIHSLVNIAIKLINMIISIFK